MFGFLIQHFKLVYVRLNLLFYFKLIELQLLLFVLKKIWWISHTQPSTPGTDVLFRTVTVKVGVPWGLHYSLLARVCSFYQSNNNPSIHHHSPQILHSGLLSYLAVVAHIGYDCNFGRDCDFNLEINVLILRNKLAF